MQENFEQIVTSMVERNAVLPSQLILEITERVAL